MGHPEGWIATDIVSRQRRMRGYNVLHPMGWDAFGLPAEQYAVQTGTHPRETTQKNIANFRRQIQSIGFSYDWSREINTTDPGYYKWTQWIFIQLYKKGLAYVSHAPVWYCPALGTVLANEEIVQTDEGPRSERGHHPVERRPLRQWMLKITAYADRLLNDLDQLDWPESLKEMQRNWIGRSEGAEVRFGVRIPHPSGAGLETTWQELKEKISVSPTTRPDTLFGATYMVLAPEHPLVEKIAARDWWEGVEKYRAQVANKSDLERTDLAKSKSGVFTGAYAVNPVNQAEIPIYIADYVLMGYGTGAIMAVPAHDERDHEFAQLHSLHIVPVVKPPASWKGGALDCFTGEGTAINSGFLDGPAHRGGKGQNHRLAGGKAGRHAARPVQAARLAFPRASVIGGEPFPVVWDGDRHEVLSENDLPLTLPELADYQPSPEGHAPLAKAKEWLQLPGGQVRETNTMPQWAGSCWYYLRYCDPHNTAQPIDPAVEKYWLGDHGVDLYIGGAEHAVLHLLYARFWHKVLFDIGVVSSPEPFHKLVNQGIILGEDNRKMSKSWGNVINPDDVIGEYGADTLRLFEMFLGPLEQMKPWSTTGVEGVYRFLGRVWRLVMEEDQEGAWHFAPGKITADAPSENLLRSLHAAIQKVTDDIEKLQFNTAISALMVLVNDLTKEAVRPRAVVETLLLLLAPFAPHIAEELWRQLGHDQTLAYEPWPAADSRYLVKSEIEMPVQINGKLRGLIKLPPGSSQEEVIATAKALPAYTEWTVGKTMRKVIVVPDKLINFVVG